MIMDLSLNVSNKSSDSSTDIEISNFFQDISYIGVSEAVMEII